MWVVAAIGSPATSRTALPASAVARTASGSRPTPSLSSTSMGRPIRSSRASAVAPVSLEV